jgi:serine/threonine-protein kinase
MTSPLALADEAAASPGACSGIVKLGGTDPVLPAVGSVVGGRYRVLRKVCEGGMGVLFEARHERLEQAVAVKVLRPRLARCHEVVRRFDREARAAARLRSVHCARVLDVDALPSGLPFIVFEYLAGHDLGVELSARGALPVDLAVECAKQAAVAMTEAHGCGIVHRDLKPPNLFLCRVPDGAEPLVKVLDFGVARIDEPTEPRITGDFDSIGTPEYMSPEQVRGSSALDARSDVWSLGVILYELVTGRTPFAGSRTSVVAHIVEDPVAPPSSLRPGIPPELDLVVLAMLEKDPARRVPAMTDVVRRLASVRA